MNDRLKEAFDNVQAEKELKNHTKNFLFRKTKGYQKKPLVSYKQLMTTAACFLLLLLLGTGYYSYFTPAFTISIDVNPSIEVGINQYDKVISINAYNEDGYSLISSLDIYFLNYKDALKQILAEKTMIQYLTQDSLISITVFSSNEEKNKEMLANISAYTDSYTHICCSSGNSEEILAAHAAGMSFGKYKAFLELQTLDPNITIEDIKDLTMQQIWDMINTLANTNDTIDITQEDMESTNHKKHSGHCFQHRHNNANYNN